MSAKIIQFPKRHRYDEWYFFQTYYALYAFVVAIWSGSILTFIYKWQLPNFDYKVKVGVGFWLIGLLLLVEVTYILGVKRNQRLKKYQQDSKSKKRVQLLGNRRASL